MITSNDLSTKAVKHLLFIFNLLFVVTGIILLVTGLTIKAFFKQYEPFLDDKYLSASSLLIFTGSIIFLVALCGCCGTLKENRYLILTFGALLSIIMIVEVSAGVTGYMMSDESSELLNKTLNQSLYQYNKNEDMTKLWDTVQSNFDCCGVNNYTDWLKVLNNSLPVSCCAFKHGSLNNFTCSQDTKELFKVGCREELGEEIKDNSQILGGVAFGIVMSQILGIILSCCLAKSFRSSSYESV